LRLTVVRRTARKLVAFVSGVPVLGRCVGVAAVGVAAVAAVGVAAVAAARRGRRRGRR